MADKLPLIEPPIRKMRGSYFPPAQPAYAGIHTVETLDGDQLYCGYSEYVARLVTACMTPRSF